VDLTAYVEKHEFCFDAVLDEHVSNDEVLLFFICFFLEQAGGCTLKMNLQLTLWNFLGRFTVKQLSP
jgi:hypothetical protein